MTELHASPTSDAPGAESSATPPPADARAFETSLGTILGRVDGAGGMYDSPDWGRYVQHRLSIWGDPVYIRIP